MAKKSNKKATGSKSPSRTAKSGRRSTASTSPSARKKRNADATLEQEKAVAGSSDERSPRPELARDRQPKAKDAKKAIGGAKRSTGARRTHSS